MDNTGDLGLGTVSKNARKRRSNLYRRPLTELESPQDSISLASTPSDRLSDVPDDSPGNHEARKELNLNQFISRSSYSNLSDAETVRTSDDAEDQSATAPWNVIMKEKGKIGNEGSCSGQSEAVSDSVGNENKVKKVRLKVGGVTHTIHANSRMDSPSVVGTSVSKYTHVDSLYPQQKLGYQENLDLDSMGEKATLRGVPWKDFSKTGFSFKKSKSSEVDLPEESLKQASKNRQPYKNKSLTKTYMSNETYDEEDDDEIRYLQKLRTSKFASSPNAEYESETKGKKLRKISVVMGRNTEGYITGIGEESKKSSSVRTSEDTDYMEDEESVSDGEVEEQNKKPRKDLIDVSGYSKKGNSITTRRRAIQAGPDSSPGLGASSVQFPEGLPPAPPRKKKEQLSELEQQLKRAEAAQRRKIQSEKAAQESQDEAIRKILGQDSSRKRREEKFKKRQQELAQERTTNNATVASNIVRWVNGPSGTVITFPNEIGLPSIFEPQPCSYPPPREKCAAPSCTNEYKYRDSKSNLPLCSLRCYKAVHDKTRPLAAC